MAALPIELKRWCQTTPSPSTIRLYGGWAALWPMNMHPCAAPRIDCGEDTSVDALVAELRADTREPLIALRKAERFVARLIRPPRPAPAEVSVPASEQPFRLVIDRPGVLDSLTLRPLDPPTPGPGEVAISVHHAALNFRDVMVAMGFFSSGVEQGLGVNVQGRSSP
ncbi:MAG: hypothetical protein R3C68_08880 [Myxococcota bacterium]